MPLFAIPWLILNVASRASPQIMNPMTSSEESSGNGSSVPSHPDLSEELARLRQEYAAAELSEDSLNPDPFRQFEHWFRQARESGLPEPNAMVLATADAAGRPSTRTVLLKAFDERGFVFYTNYQSRKVVELDQNAQAAATFPWFPLQRQVNVMGSTERVSRQESIRYFLTRPRGSQLGAWVSDQSQVISSRSILEMKLQEMKRKFSRGEVPLPDHWGGIRIVPQVLEFWQGRPNRLHDRLRYVREGGSWRIERLAP